MQSLFSVLTRSGLTLLLLAGIQLHGIEVEYSRQVRDKPAIQGTVDFLTYVANELPEINADAATIQVMHLGRVFLTEKGSPVVMIEMGSEAGNSVSKMMQRRYQYIDTHLRPVDSWPANWKRFYNRTSSSERLEDKKVIWFVEEHAENEKAEAVLNGAWIAGLASFDLGKTKIAISLNDSIWQDISEGRPAPDLHSIAKQIYLMAKAWGFDQGLAQATAPAEAKLSRPVNQGTTQAGTTQSDEELLRLWNQKGTVETVTDKEKADAEQALLAFLEKQKAPLRRTCSNLDPENIPDEQTLETAVLLTDIGIPVAATDITPPIPIKGADNVIDKIEVEFENEDPATPLMTTGDVFRSALANQVIEGIKDLPDWEGTPEHLSSELQNELSGKAKTNGKPLEVFNENWLDRMLKPMEDEIAIWTDDTSKPKPLTDEEKKAKEKEANKSTAQQIFDLAAGKTKDLVSGKIQDKITDKIKNRGESGERFLDNVDKLSKLKDCYDTAKDIKKDYDTLQKDMRETGTGLALFKVGCKVVGKGLGKLGPLGEAAEKYIDVASKTADAASQATKEFYEGAAEGEVLIQDRSNPANRVLKAVKASEKVEDFSYYAFDLPTSEGETRKVNVGGWKKVTVKGETHYQVLDQNGNPTDLVMQINNPPWYRVFGDHEARFYDLKTGEEINKIKVDI